GPAVPRAASWSSARGLAEGDPDGPAGPVGAGGPHPAGLAGAPGRPGVGRGPSGRAASTRTVWPGRRPARTSARVAGSGVAVPSTAVTSSPARSPALAAGPPGWTLVISRPPLVVAATSTPR